MGNYVFSGFLPRPLDDVYVITQKYNLMGSNLVCGCTLRCSRLLLKTRSSKMAEKIADSAITKGFYHHLTTQGGIPCDWPNIRVRYCNDISKNRERRRGLVVK
jgi:hypothetical protein